MKNIIYGLRDPRNDVYYYIGKSTVGKDRPLQHLFNSHSDKVNEWIANLSKDWLYPEIDIIEEVKELENLVDREKYWIDYYYNINPDLLNMLLLPLNENNTLKEDEANFDNVFKLLSEISSIFKKARLARNLSQIKLAGMMDSNRSTIVNLENGCDVSYKSIMKYALALKGVDIQNRYIRQRARKEITKT